MAATNNPEASPDEKFDKRVQSWLSPQGIAFKTPQIEQDYRQRVEMIKDAIALKKPSRVPLCPWIGFFQVVYGGATVQESMYDYRKLGTALEKFHTDFMPDIYSGAALFGSGKLLDILDYKVYRWAGNQLGESIPFQCVEDEYMRADEYDILASDPTGYFMNSYLPRTFGALEGLRMLPSLPGFMELATVSASMIPFGLPEMQQSLEKLMEAGKEAMAWVQAASETDARIMGSLGLPPFAGGITKAPFDMIGDTLRGTRHVMLDMFRRPQKLMETLERLVPPAIAWGVRTVDATGVPVVVIPLHKGADGFMSRDGFKKFYWPTLKAVILGLIAEGIVPCLFVEGGYNQRLDIIADPDIPAGKSIWMFDRTDLREVKKLFSGWACFGGNVPGSIIATGTPQLVRDYVRDLLGDVSADGGFILGTGSVIDDATAENMHAFFVAGREFGSY